ncbi:MAG TPA: hypothetical protein VFW44_15335 [Bryobacteraceae bacterium]|nr:hypothetical protein [Bryobacteraceae bacterium]
MSASPRLWPAAATNYLQTLRGLRAFVRTPPLADPISIVKRQVDNREKIFLETLRRVIFDTSSSPYGAMFQLARCSYEDAAGLVRSSGLESTLEKLRAAGVYMSQDEFKGNSPIVRDGQEIAAHSSSFRNPLVSGAIRHVSSGSRGRAVQTFRSSSFTLHQEAMHELVVREFHLQDRAQIILRPTLPSTLGFQDCAFVARKGHRLEGWYASGASGAYAPATSALVIAARVSGCRLPFPTVLQDNDFSPAARSVARLSANGVQCLVSGPVSPAVRLASAALDQGLDIAGTLFLVSGESLTDAKRAVVERAGGMPFARYGVSELGFIGHGCRHMTEGDCVHLYANAIAAIAHARTAPRSEFQVQSLFFTTLLPTAPLVLINLEVDDCGRLEKALCDCEFSRAGLNWSIRDIFSFGKMTGHGVTLIGTDLIRLLEDILPARLGGGPGDYQLLERDGPAQTKVELRVSPRVPTASVKRIRQCFLDEVGALYGGSLAGRIWSQTEAVEVVLAEPIATASGKVHPLHLIGEQSTRDRS